MESKNMSSERLYATGRRKTSSARIYLSQGEGSIKVINAKQNVTAIFPVTLTPRGVNPNRFRNQIKKKRVKRKLI